MNERGPQGGPLRPIRFIAVEGPIGVGKTTLVRRLAACFGTDPVLEGAADNPYLEKYYAEPARFALPAQIHFLFQRVEQLQSLGQDDLFRNVHVSDYILEKDRLFARLTLEPDDFALYERLWDRIVERIPVPDLVIVLQARVPTLLDRIAGRGRRYERDIDSRYLERLNGAYAELFKPITIVRPCSS